MKGINRILLLATTVVALTSCQKEGLEILDASSPSSGSGLRAEIPVYEAEVGSKTAFGGDEGLTFSWASEDKLGVLVPSSLMAKELTLKDGAGTGSATFETSDLTAPNNEYVYAVYPSVTEGLTIDQSGVKYAFSLYTEQTQTYADGALTTSSIGQYAAMYGRTATKVSSKDLSIPFTHVNSIFDFVLSEIPSGTKINSLTLTTTDKFATTATVDFEGGVTFTGDTKSIKVTSTGDVTGDTQTIRLAMFPETVTADVEWTVTLNVTFGGATTDVTFVKTFSGEGRAYLAGNAYLAALSYNTFKSATVKEALTAKDMTVGTLRGVDDKFLARYAFDAVNSKIKVSYFENDTILKHSESTVTVSDATLSWGAITVAEGITFSSISYDATANTLSSNQSATTLKQQTQNLQAHSTSYHLWNVKSTAVGVDNNTYGDAKYDFKTECLKAFVNAFQFDYDTFYLNGISGHGDLKFSHTASGKDIRIFEKNYYYKAYGNSGEYFYPEETKIHDEGQWIFHRDNMQECFKAWFADEGMIMVIENNAVYLLSPSGDGWFKFVV